MQQQYRRVTAGHRHSVSWISGEALGILRSLEFCKSRAQIAASLISLWPLALEYQCNARGTPRGVVDPRFKGVSD